MEYITFIIGVSIMYVYMSIKYSHENIGNMYIYQKSFYSQMRYSSLDLYQYVFNQLLLHINENTSYNDVWEMAEEAAQRYGLNARYLKVILYQYNDLDDYDKALWQPSREWVRIVTSIDKSLEVDGSIPYPPAHALYRYSIEPRERIEKILDSISIEESSLLVISFIAEWEMAGGEKTAAIEKLSESGLINSFISKPTKKTIIKMLDYIPELADKILLIKIKEI